MRSIIGLLLLNLLTDCSVSFIVTVPPGPLVAHVGSTVILPCWISPAQNAEALEIRWYRHGEFRNTVLLYQRGKIQDEQEKSFRNRSSLTPRSDHSEGLKGGDVSLKLEKIIIQDEGSFHCYVSGDSAYGSKDLELKVTAPGSAPVLFPRPLDDDRLNVSCRSSGWYPEPNITWTSDQGKTLPPAGVSLHRGADGLFSVHSWTTVSPSDAQLVSCSVSTAIGESKEGKLDIQGLVSSDSSEPWKALFITFTLLFCVLLGLAGWMLYKYSGKLTERKHAGTDCEDVHVEERKVPVPVAMNMEELRKHAEQISIDRESLSPDLKISSDCKSVRDSPDYHPTAEGFPYQLCAFGAQQFTSGRHYWEVQLAAPPIPPKISWLIGVVKHGNYCVKDRSAYTPSRGFWFLSSDGGNGFYTNTDPPITLSISPRPERLGVLLDYDAGLLSFYSVKESKHLLTMSTRFSGSIVPLFNPGVGDASPLKIVDCPVAEESPAEVTLPLLSNCSTVA
ncbi:butyrophilin subfamily 1 member A1-like [Danio aesculapii]|uniref:butyrophilin subfamily 1 member A1-like n=1 Tax=Danio aesculapii TaxID=1142201 RepID=UPI0024C0890B|nr:butyrophilin subfamily 1 member A1-like [Danio aesculapii]